jgi:protein-L-isoaspartate(D-aspartate) O-methyltransferase
MPADFEAHRRQMLAEISATTVGVRGLIGKAALDERVMKAIGEVPRHEFVAIELQPYAHANRPLPIGIDKTISQDDGGRVTMKEVLPVQFSQLET